MLGILLRYRGSILLLNRKRPQSADKIPLGMIAVFHDYSPSIFQLHGQTPTRTVNAATIERYNVQ